MIHAALDVVDELVWSTQAMYLKQVDRFNDFYVSAFVTASHARFMLLHDARNEDGVKQFFADAYEAYVRLLMNPFFDSGAKVPASFDQRIRLLGKKHF